MSLQVEAEAGAAAAATRTQPVSPLTPSGLPRPMEDSKCPMFSGNSLEYAQFTTCLNIYQQRLRSKGKSSAQVAQSVLRTCFSNEIRVQIGFAHDYMNLLTKL